MLSGGRGVRYATWAHDSASFSHAANNATLADFGGVDVGARRIRPFGPDQEYCSDNVFGIWVNIIAPQERKPVQGENPWDTWLDGVLLPATYTAWKRAPHLQGFFEEETIWWQAIGVPVYGMLDPGSYHIYSEWLLEGELLTFETNVNIVDCSD